MSEFRSPSLPERNPLTHAKHRREVRWQITLPFILGLVLCVALSALALFPSAQQTSVLADVSLIWLITPLLFISLIVLAVLGGLVYAVILIIRALPPAARKAQVFLANLQATVKRIADILAEPVIKTQAFSAKVKAFRRNLRG